MKNACSQATRNDGEEKNNHARTHGQQFANYVETKNATIMNQCTRTKHAMQSKHDPLQSLTLNNHACAVHYLKTCTPKKLLSSCSNEMGYLRHPTTKYHGENVHCNCCATPARFFWFGMSLRAFLALNAGSANP